MYSSPNTLLVGHLRNVLESCGVPATLRNQWLGGGAGDLPPTECWLELWVERDADAQRAADLLAAELGPGLSAGPAWRCPACGEVVEGQFTECWRCGASRSPD